METNKQPTKKKKTIRQVQHILLNKTYENIGLTGAMSMLPPGRAVVHGHPRPGDFRFLFKRKLGLGF